MSLPTVVPSLVTLMCEAVTFRSVMAPVPSLVLPPPLLPRKITSSVPVPTLRLVLAACVITALPASRSASTTPPPTPLTGVTHSLPMIDKFAFLSPMPALSNTERPACKVNPPLDDTGAELTAVLTVMSLLACSVTDVPASSNATKFETTNLLVVDAFALNPTVGVIASGTAGPKMSTRPVKVAPEPFHLGDDNNARPSNNALTAAPPAPIWSPVVVPTKLLISLLSKMPLTPMRPLIQVAAPLALAVVPLPLPHSGDKATALPLLNAVTVPEPTSSPAADPTKLLLLESTPEIPKVPLPQVMAPLANAVVPPLHRGERTM